MTPSNHDARGARNPAMNTLPIAGVWMKYANMNWLIVPCPLDATMKIVLATVIATGIQRACVCVAIHGTAARSWRTLIGRNDIRNASANPTLPVEGAGVVLAVGDPDGRAFAVLMVDVPGAVMAGSSSPGPSSSIGWGGFGGPGGGGRGGGA